MTTKTLTEIMAAGYSERDAEIMLLSIDDGAIRAMRDAARKSGDLERACLADDALREPTTVSPADSARMRCARMIFGA